MPFVDYSFYLKSKNCCKKIVETCTPGPQGPPGNSKNASLFYNNLLFEAGGVSTAGYNSITTSNNGFERYININNNLIDFNSLTSLVSSNICFLEIYSHCDAKAGDTGTGNFIKIDLSGVILEPNSLQTVDIDTRSVEKGIEEHLSFGPVLYKLVNNSNANNNLCINTKNTYSLRVSTGRPYELTEIKLIIKLIIFEN